MVGLLRDKKNDDALLEAANLLQSTMQANLGNSPASADAPRKAGETSRSAGPEPWDGPLFSAKPAEMLEAAAARPAPKDAGFEILFEEHVHSFDAQGRHQVATRRAVRYLTPAAVEENASVACVWSPWRDDKPSIRARVITADGVSHLLDAKSIGETPVGQREANVWSDRRVISAPLPSLAPKAVVEEETVVRERQPFFAPGIVVHCALNNFSPARKLRLVVEVPAGSALRYEVRGSDLKPVRSEKEGRLKLVFETRPAKVLKLPEPFLPPEMPSWPEVVFSTGKSWTDVAAGYDAIVRRQLEPEAVRPIAREAVGGEIDREKAVARLLGKIRKLVRYTGVEFGSAEIVPRTPSETLARGYGDCKDQATLLVSMLRAVGMPAHVALLHAGIGADVMPGMPGLGRFNHAIVCMPGNPPLWIDPSAAYVPAGRLPVSDQGRWAMIVDPSTKDLVRVPKSDYRQNRSTTTIEYFIRNSDDSRVRETVSWSGTCEQGMRSMFGTDSEEDLRKSWRSRAKEVYHALSMTRLEHTSAQDLATPFRIAMEADNATIAGVDDTTTIVPLMPASLFSRLPWLFLQSPPEKGLGAEKKEPGEENPATARRKAPLVLAEPHVREIIYEITPPPGFASAALPRGATEHAGPATITQLFEARGDKVVATFRLDTGPGAFTAAEVEALRRLIAKLGPKGDRPRWTISLTFKHAGAVHLAAGRFKEALATYRRLAEQYPRQCEQHSRYAGALLKLGLGEAARREARRAVEVEPQSANAYAHLGFVLIHDLFGRILSKGMDRSAAEAAFRKALELSPSHRVARLNRAVLLEYDDSGWRYGPGADLKQAVAEFRKAAADPAGLGEHSFNPALDLLLDGDFAELEKLAAEQDPSPEKAVAWKSMAVAAAVAQHGAAAGEKKAAEISEDPKERWSVLATASDFLDKARLYPESVAMVDLIGEAASEIHPGTIDARTAIMVRKALKRFEQWELPARDPRHVVQQLLRSVWSDGLYGPPAASLYVKGTTDAERNLLAGQIRLIFGDLRAMARERDTPPRRAGDAATVYELRSEGDDAIGYRIWCLAAAKRRMEWYVVREKSDYRLFAQGPWCANLGRLVLDRLHAHDEKGAKQWLQWAWDVHRPLTSWFNPFAGSPFGQFWLSAEAARPENIRLAAAMLLASSSTPQLALPLLTEARKNTENPGLRLQIDRALLLAYQGANRPEDVCDVAERILKDHNRREVVLAELTALHPLGKRDPLRRILQDQFQKSGQDAGWEEALALAATLRRAVRPGDAAAACAGGAGQAQSRCAERPGVEQPLRWFGQRFFSRYDHRGGEAKRIC